MFHLLDHQPKTSQNATSKLVWLHDLHQHLHEFTWVNQSFFFNFLMFCWSLPMPHGFRPSQMGHMRSGDLVLASWAISWPTRCRNLFWNRSIVPWILITWVKSGWIMMIFFYPANIPIPNISQWNFHYHLLYWFQLYPIILMLNLDQRPRWIIPNYLPNGQISL